MSRVLRKLQSFFKCSKFYINTFFGEELSALTNIDNAMEEMHIIAYVYHWERDTLKSLPIRERRRWAERIIKQREAENSALENN